MFSIAYLKFKDDHPGLYHHYMYMTDTGTLGHSLTLHYYTIGHSIIGGFRGGEGGKLPPPTPPKLKELLYKNGVFPRLYF